jgi:hypothetical protein
MTALEGNLQDSPMKLLRVNLKDSLHDAAQGMKLLSGNIQDSPHDAA